MQEATVTGIAPHGIFAIMRDSGAGSLIYRATLRPNVALAAGTYTGELQVHFCKGAGCAQEYSASAAASATK